MLMGLPYPLLTTIHNVDDLDHFQTQDIIIKRTYSSCSQHVLFGNAADYQLKGKLKSEMDLTHKNWSMLPTPQQPVWFIQPLLPTMSENCEVRCFFVGMKWLYSVVTHFVDGKIEVGPLWGCLPLSNIMYVIFKISQGVQLSSSHKSGLENIREKCHRNNVMARTMSLLHFSDQSKRSY
jgi:hypothetical protein